MSQDRTHTSRPPRSDRRKDGQAGYRGARRQPSQATPARRAALEVVSAIRTDGGYVHEVADRLFRDIKMSKEDRAFALLLATGVASTAGALDEHIDAVLSDPDDVKPAVRDALRISTYELFFLNKSAHAAVDQGVNLVRGIAPRATGVANFALRRLAQRAESVHAVIESGDLSDAAAAQVAAAYGFPEWIVAKLDEQRGREWTLRFLSWSNESAPAYFMVNQYRVNGPKTFEALAKGGVLFSPASLPCGVKPVFPVFVLRNRRDLSHQLMKGLLDEGALVVSDASAQAIAVLALPVRKPRRFLEIGAGRGSKTIMIQEAARARFGGPVALDSVELNAKKVAQLKRRLSRAQVPVERFLAVDATDLSSLEADSYDAVFIDAPCSGVGTLRRHSEIRWRLAESDLDELARIGGEMLEQAARVTAPGGLLTYATCTVFAEENQRVIERFLSSEAGAGFELVKLPVTDEGYFETPLQEGGADLHFATVLHRIA